MKRIIIFIISLWSCLFAGAHSPNTDSLDVYVDNIYVGKMCCMNLVRIPAVFMKCYYRDFIDAASDSESSDRLSRINPASIKRMFIEKPDQLGGFDAMHLRTRRAKSGYLYVNECVGKALDLHGCKHADYSVSYVYNDKDVLTCDDVKKFLSLKKNRIVVGDCLIDDENRTIRVCITGK